MNIYTLAELTEKYGQERVAKFFGINQSAISKALKTKRNIFVVEKGNGVFEAEERRPFPQQKKSKKCRQIAA